MVTYGKRKYGRTSYGRMSKKRRTVPRRTGLSRFAGKFTARKSSYPTRLRGSRIQYSLNRAVGRIMNGLAENKCLSTTAVNEKVAIPIQTLAKAYYNGFVLGGLPTGWDTSLTDLAGTTIPAGSGQNQRNGDSVYLRKTRLTFEIDAQPVAADQSPVPKEYRMIVVKTNRKATPAGITPQPQQSLFLTTDGQEFGYQTSGFTGADAMIQPINKKYWSVYKDTRFRLTNPALYNEVGSSASWNWTNQKYGSTKRVSMDLPHYGKASFGASNKPENLDCHYAVFIFARAIGQDYAADDWEVNVRGTTSYKDM